MIVQLIFFIPLFFIFVLEGLGWSNGRIVAFYLILIWPLIIFFYSYISKKQLVYPPKITSIFFWFFFFSFVSLLFSVNVEESINYLFYYLAVFILFFYFYNYQKTLRKKTVVFFIFLGLFFVGYSFFINYYLPDSLQFLIPNRGFQYVYPYYKTHNPLASLLLIPITIMLVYQPIKNKMLNNLIFILFIFFILISFSRSSYLALVLIILISIFLGKSEFNFKKAFLMVFLAGFFISVQFSFQEGYLKKISTFINKKLSKNIVLESKSFLGSRNEYFKQAILAIRQRPIFGFGPGNFLLISQKFTQGNAGTAGTADNIFLEIFAENGVIAGIFFIVLVFLVIKGSWRTAKENQKVNLGLFFVLLIMLLVFQIDSVQRFYSYFLSFFIIAGLLYREPKEKIISLNFNLLLVLLLLILPLNQYLSQRYLNIGRFRLALIHNPFNQQAYQSLIESLIVENKISAANKYLKIYQRLFSGVDEALEEIAGFYEELGNQKQAKKYYLKTIEANPSKKIGLISKIYQLDLALYGKETAQKNLKENIVQYYLAKNFDQSWQVKGKISLICYKVGDGICRQAGVKLPVFYSEPKPNTVEEINPHVPYKAKYKINSDGLNERFDYSVDKPKGVFRIIALGESNTFGLYVNTKDNWTEILEDKLNQKLQCLGVSRFEVINLGMHGYDIEYMVHRFYLKGIKYQPDFVLWQLRLLMVYQLNELLLPKINLLNKQLEKSNQLDVLVKQKVFYPAFMTAYIEVIKEIGREAILEKQTEFFDQYQKIYPKKTLIFTQGEMTKQAIDFFESQVERMPNARLLVINELNDDRFYFPGTGSLNQTGHRLLAETIFRYLIENDFIQSRLSCIIYN